MATHSSILSGLKSSLDEQPSEGIRSGTEEVWFDLRRSDDTGVVWRASSNSSRAPGSPSFRSTSLIELGETSDPEVAVGGARGILRASRPEPGKINLASMSSTSVGDDSSSPGECLGDGSLSGSRMSTRDGSHLSRRDGVVSVDAALKGFPSCTASSSSQSVSRRSTVRGGPNALMEERWVPSALRPRRESIDIAWAATRLDRKGPVVKLNLCYQMLSSTDGIELVKGREKIAEVDLSSNNIESFGLANGLQWRNLLVLNLASCMLSKLYRIEWPPQLRHFIVSNNRLKRFDCALPKALESLECQHNRLETLEETEGLKRLSRLNASHNALTWGTVRDALRSLSGLVVLDLGYNPIDKIEVGVFVRIRGLQELTLDGCRLKSLGFVPEGNVLSVLSVACNRLKGIQGLPVCERLTELYLSSNRLSTLRGLARACPNVEVLQLMNNKLEEGRSVAEELTALKDLAELTFLKSILSAECESQYRLSPRESYTGLEGKEKSQIRLEDSLEGPERSIAAKATSQLLEKLQPRGFWDETKLSTEWTSPMEHMIGDLSAATDRLTTAARKDLRKMTKWLAKAEEVLEKEAYLRGLEEGDDDDVSYASILLEKPELSERTV